jgi:hypothetical protein
MIPLSAKVLLFLASIFACQPNDAKAAGKLTIPEARITYYTGHSKPVADPKAKRGIAGISIAAHPDFKIGTRVFIPALKGSPVDSDGIFTIQDRGPAVTKKTASKGKRYVFDVCVNPKDKGMMKFVKTMPENMDVIILHE